MYPKKLAYGHSGIWSTSLVSYAQRYCRYHDVPNFPTVNIKLSEDTDILKTVRLSANNTTLWEITRGMDVSEVQVALSAKFG